MGIPRNAVQRKHHSQAAVSNHSPADCTVGACTWQARYDYMSITYTDICACFPASSIMYAGYTIIPNGRPTWAPLLAASGQQLAVSNGSPTNHEPRITSHYLPTSPAESGRSTPHGPVMYITIYSQRAALWDGPYAGPGRGVFTS